MSGLVIDCESVCDALTFVFFSRFAEGAQLRVPVGFEGVGDESVRGCDVHIALASEVDFVLRALDLSMTQAISFVEATLDLLLHGERHLERDGRDGLDEQSGDGIVDRGAHDALAKRIGETSAASDAHVDRHLPLHVLARARGIADVHAAATEAADGASLQKRRPLTRRRSIEVKRLGRRLKSLLVARIIVPRDVSGMGVANEREPLLGRPTLASPLATWVRAAARATIGIRAGVPRAVQDVRVACAAPVREKVSKSSRTLSWTCLSGSRTTRPCPSWTKPTGRGRRSSPCAPC